MKPQNATLVAVYGTLRRDYGNHRIIARGDGDDLGNGKSIGWRMYSWGGFPAICEGTDTEEIVVEVYAVDADTLRNLDSLEGYRPDAVRNDFYDRKFTTVILDNGETVEALIYCMPEHRAADRASVIESGDWKLHEDQRGSQWWKRSA